MSLESKAWRGQCLLSLLHSPSGRWAGRGQTRTHQTPPSGYPNEEAAEVVLATLREWLEQHKDKVRVVGSEAGAGVPSAELMWWVGTCPP